MGAELEEGALPSCLPSGLQEAALLPSWPAHWGHPPHRGLRGRKTSFASTTIKSMLQKEVLNQLGQARNAKEQSSGSTSNPAGQRDSAVKADVGLAQVDPKSSSKEEVKKAEVRKISSGVFLFLK